LIASLSVEARLTLCNMAVELGARTCIVAPDETTFAWLAKLPHAPRGEMSSSAHARWRELRSDDDANFDTDLTIDCTGLVPQITWGTSPAQVTSIAGHVPATAAQAGLDEAIWQRALGYMDLAPGARLAGTRIDRVFIGSCTNARLEDIESAARVAVGRKVAFHVKAVVVPGSRAVSRQAERQGLRDILVDAGFLWGEPGCSMCAGGGGEKVSAGERIVSTTNRNFEGRQGAGVRTHLASPATAAAAAVMGEICDPRPLIRSPESA
jgi:3-isopropylmalate/(R)-2-methylmalate dehydratase large subunit